MRISVARQLVNAAIEAEDSATATAISMAKAYASETAVEVAGKAMQLHGGVGYTWESGVHVYLKRAALNRSLFGSPAEHRARIAATNVCMKGIRTATNRPIATPRGTERRFSRHSEGWRR